VIQACARYDDPAALAAALLPDALPLVELVPELRAHAVAPLMSRSADPDTARFRLFQTLAGCLARAATRARLPPAGAASRSAAAAAPRASAADARPGSTTSARATSSAT
jgi:hypothetical protein